MKSPLPPVIMLLGVFLGIVVQPVLSQPERYILSVDALSATENNPLEIRIDLAPGPEYLAVYLYYRPYGQTDFKELETVFTGTRAFTVIPAADVTPPFIEYYFLLETTTDGVVTFPPVEPDMNPLLAPVSFAGSASDPAVILSPERNEELRFSDLVISVSLLNTSEEFDRSATRIHIGRTDVTAYALITDEILILVPSNIDGYSLPPGRHTVSVEFNRPDGGGKRTLSWSFSITSGIAPQITAPSDYFAYNLSLRGESRNETIAGNTVWYNRTNMIATGRITWARFSSNLLLTNEERGTRQPQNRYSFNADSRWLRFSVGDTYPRFPTLVMNGRRLRGFSGSLELGYINLDYATGQTIRSVEGRQLYTFAADSLDAQGQPLIPPPNSRLINDSTYAVYSYGSFTRNLTAIRPSFGTGSPVQVGFTYLESKDDIGSIGVGNKPGQNLVLGSDISISLDNRRFEVQGQVAGSIQNTDISGGNLTQEELDDLLGEGTARRIERVIKLSTLQKYMTINQYLIPLDPTRLSSVAYDLSMRMHYFGNYLQVGYIRRGNDYQSHGLTALRRDVAGVQIRDRLRLYRNQIFVDLSSEMLRDNLGNQKTHTTYINNHLVSVAYYPRRDWPSVTVGYGYYRNDNRVDPGGVDRRAAVRDITNRIFTSLSHSFLWGIRHNGSLSMTYSNRDDQTGVDADVTLFNVSTMVTSYFETLPLQTNMGIGVYTSKIPLELIPLPDGSFTFRRSGFNYVNFIVSGSYRLLEDRLLLNAAWIPTFGDYNRIGFQSGAQYSVLRNVSLVFQADYLMNPDSRNDFISYLMIRYDL